MPDIFADEVSAAAHLRSYSSQRLNVIAPLTTVIGSDREPLNVLLCSSGSRNRQFSSAVNDREDHCAAEYRDRAHLLFLLSLIKWPQSTEELYEICDTTRRDHKNTRRESTPGGNGAIVQKKRW